MWQRISVIAFLVLFAHSFTSAADDVYLSPEAFIEESFNGQTPAPKVLWIKSDLKPAIKKILGHDYSSFRVRYWSEGNRTVWILEEIGKVKPITAGFVIEEGEIAQLKVLIYRESHGWEVKYPFFTNQFKGSTLNDKNGLKNNIDGISGATLSVNALKRLSRLALYFHKQVYQ